MNVVAYTRVSTDGQVGEDKFGLDAQKEQIIAYCKENNMDIVRWYTDEGESGAKRRPGFDEIVFGDVTNPPFEAVVVAKTDRVARDINVYFYYKTNLLINKNIQLISVQEDFGQVGVLKDALEMFMITCAKLERENIMKRTQAGLKIKAERGGYSGGHTPYGYRPQNGHMVIVPEQAEVVKLIFEMKDGGATYAQVRDELNRRGYKNKSGTDFGISTVQAIYENRKTYQGYYKYGQGDWVEGQHEAILSREN